MRFCRITLMFQMKVCGKNAFFYPSGEALEGMLLCQAK